MLLLTDFGPGAIQTFREHRGPLTGTSPKLTDMIHSGQFSMVLLTNLGSVLIRTFGEHQGPLMGTSPKFADLVHSGQFSMVLLTDFRSRVNPDVWGTPEFAYVDLAKTHRFGPFWPVFHRITN